MIRELGGGRERDREIDKTAEGRERENLEIACTYNIDR